MTKHEDENTEEIWESQVAGRTFVETRDYDGRRRSESCMGMGSRLRISKADRKRYQERIRNVKLDPFRNGSLLRADADQQEDEATASLDALSEDDLKSVFEMDMDDFRDYVGGLSEVNIRRLKAMAADQNATVNQNLFLQDLIAERFSIGGDTPTYRELKSGPATP